MVSQFWTLGVEIKVSAKMIAPHASLLGLMMAVFTPSPPIAPPLGVCVLSTFPSQDTNRVGLGSTLIISLYPNSLFKDPVSKYSHIMQSWGL